MRWQKMYKITTNKKSEVFLTLTKKEFDEKYF